MHPQLYSILGSKVVLIGMDQEQLSSTSEEVTEKAGSKSFQWCVAGQCKITDKLKWEVLFYVRKNEDRQVVEQANQRGCTVSIHGSIQDLTR